MQGKHEGLYLCTRHSPDCKYHREVEFDRDESRRCNCVKYVRGTAPDGTRIRKSAGTTGWEKARKFFAKLIAEHDPNNRGLFNLALASGAVSQRKTVEEAIRDFIDTKRGENLVDVTHYEGLFQRELLVWCKQRGIHYVDELTLDLVTKFRNSLHNLGTVKNRKLSPVRTPIDAVRKSGLGISPD